MELQDIKYRALIKTGGSKKRHVVYSKDYATLSQFFSAVESFKDQGIEVRMMRGTGREDKEGVEVYEGDRLRYTAIIGGVERKSQRCIVVEWNELRARFTGIESLDKKKVVGMMEWG